MGRSNSKTTAIKLMTAILIAAILLGCSKNEPTVHLTLPQIEAPVSERAKSVLVVINSASSASTEIGSYYVSKRKIPKENVVFVTCRTDEEIATGEFQSKILNPIREAVQKSKTRIDFIVTTKGLPLRLDNGGGFSVDGHIAAMNKTFEPIKKLEEADIMRSVNPYFGQNEPFNSKKFDLYLVCRLTGYTVDDAKALVDHSLAAKPVKGPFFFDQASNREGGGYKTMQDLLKTAHESLSEKGYQSSLDTAKAFIAPDQALMGYCSWGSNDGAFQLDTYKKLQFLPGALCETYVSTSGRTFKPTKGGQSLIADLIANGVTGIKGYVSEPYTFALARPNILFDRYVSGFNLAESFYMASPVIKWKDVVVGDPLCSPYASQ